MGGIKLTIAFASMAHFGFAAGVPTHAADQPDYARADHLRTIDPQRLGGRVFPHWLRDGTRFYYLSRGDAEQRGTVFLVDTKDGSRRAFFDGGKVAASLSRLTKSKVQPTALPKFSLTENEERIAFDLPAGVFVCVLKTSQCAPFAASQETRAPSWAVRSPDGKWDAFIWDHNVYIRPAAFALKDEAKHGPVAALEANGNYRFAAPLRRTLGGFQPTGQRKGCDLGVGADTLGIAAPAYAPPPQGSIALTKDGHSEWSYGPRWKGGAEVATLDADRYRPTRGGFAWSPDSTRLLVRREDIRGVGVYPLYSSTNTRPVDHSYYYAKPGDAKIPVYDFYILDVDKQTSRKVDVPSTGLALAPGGAEWSPDGRELFVLSSTRGSKSVTLSRVDPATGSARPIIEERSKTFVEMSNGDDDNIVAITKDGDDIFWFSERSGWGHLYRYDRDGKLKNQLEDGDYSVAELIRIDEEKQQVFFTAWGKELGIPYYRHLYRINFDGSGLVHLTPEPGDHFIQWSPDGSSFVDTISAIAKPPVTVLKRADGTRISELSRGRTEVLEAIGWRAAEPFTVKARDGVTTLYGVMHKPSNFDPAKKYPIITNLYPGPFKGSVGRTWSFQGPDNYEVLGEGGSVPTHGEGMGQSLAELGFIVIKLDAMGTARRSKPFQDQYYGKVIDNGLPDQVAAIKQLAAQHSWIDDSRVGIFGHSGGGYSAAAGMLLYPDFFKVGVAEAGNHDFRSYGWYWGEKYQGLMETAADRDAYEAQANYKYADRLKGKLLLIHGDMDCNNPPAQTLRLTDALIKQQKDFDMLIVPDSGHQLPAYAMRRAWDYFLINLKGEQPPKDYKLLQREF